ncbi:MAG TPA: transcriptional regulator FilR1 domain-containing protein [Methanobacterium sp.]|nr:transcriptional regulator FilR1 domain-containing protein [Methanobacterium sp.]
MNNNKALFDFYDEVKDELKFLIKSDVRIKILMCLSDEEKNIAQLKREIGLTSSTILHGIYQLEEKDIIVRKSGNYALSKTGEIYQAKLLDMVKSVYALKNCGNIFLNHDIECIPPELLKDLGSLENSRLVNSVATDILRPHKILLEYLQQSRHIKHISSVLYSPNIKIIFSNLHENEVHLLLTREILDKIVEEISYSIIEKHISQGNLKLGIINDNTRISFTLGDQFMSLGLYFQNGDYDLNNFLMSESKEALNWGNKLFKYHEELSTDFNELKIP